MTCDTPDAIERQWIDWVSNRMAEGGRPLDGVDVVFPEDATVPWRVDARLPSGWSAETLGRDGNACHSETLNLRGRTAERPGEGPASAEILAAAMRLWRRTATLGDAAERPAWSVLAHPLTIAACLSIDPRRSALPLGVRASTVPRWREEVRPTHWLEDACLIGTVHVGDVAVDASRRSVCVVAPVMPRTVLTALQGASLGVLAALERTGHPDVDEAVAALRIRECSGRDGDPSTFVYLEPAAWIPYDLPPGAHEEIIMATGPVYA